MLRVARMYVSTLAVAEEVVQDAWLGVLQGLDRFEGRSSLRTWIFRILTNTAKTRGQREGRSVPFASIAGDDLEAPSFDEAWFRPEGTDNAGSLVERAPRLARPARGPAARGRDPRGRSPGCSTKLPPMQAEVMRLRDVAGWSAEEVRNALDLTETNQRVLLHRARAKLRRALDDYLGDEG